MDNGAVDAGQLATLSLLGGRGYGYGGIGVGGVAAGAGAVQTYGGYGAGGSLYVGDKIDSSNDRQTLENIRISEAGTLEALKCQNTASLVALNNANSARMVDNLNDNFKILDNKNETRFNALQAENRKNFDLINSNTIQSLRDKNAEQLIANQTLKFDLSQLAQTCKLQCEPSCNDKLVDAELASIKATLVHLAHKVG